MKRNQAHDDEVFKSGQENFKISSNFFFFFKATLQMISSGRKRRA